jgi:hypothetical protein
MRPQRTRRATRIVTGILIGLLYAAAWLYGILFFAVAFSGGDVASGLPALVLAVAVILFVHRSRSWPPFARPR